MKRRSDGSRYITRKDRNKILKERAQKLSNERAGLTTDDDAMSELKVGFNAIMTSLWTKPYFRIFQLGRYWNRNERKKHLERARQRKLQQEQLIRAKAALFAHGGDQQKIVELSHKKMARRKEHALFDDFTTLQELLTHGSREANTASSGGILSVTTVWMKCLRYNWSVLYNS